MKKRLVFALAVLMVLVWIAIIFLLQDNSVIPAVPVTGDASSQTPIHTPLVVDAGLPTVVTFIPLVSKPASPTPTPQVVATPGSTSVPTAAQTAPPVSSPILESFESADSTWKVSKVVAGSGKISQASTLFNDRSNSALISTAASGSKAFLQTTYSEPASAHAWQERPGTWFWQRTSLYIPTATIQALGANDFLTIAGLYPSSGGTFGWWLRIKQGAALYVFGYDANGAGVEFPVYGVFPQNQWVELSLGLHSQNGPGVKRAFSFLINGNFYGWYHQGHMVSETYDRAGFGILDGNTSKSVQVYVDSWRNSSSGPFPDGPDNRPVNNLQEQDYRNKNGIQWQIDWSTWKNNLVQAPGFGLYSASDRLQSGRNLDRIPDLTSGWAEIEIDWPNGTPSTTPTEYFGPMVGFRKEINREENLEVIPIGRGGGAVDLVLEAWVNGGPLQLAAWPLPAQAGGGTHIPAPGDIIRVRWQQINADQLTVKASYYDASANFWHNNVINVTISTANIGGINFNDGYHKASSITIDSSSYSIRRFKVGTIDTAP